MNVLSVPPIVFKLSRAPRFWSDLMLDTCSDADSDFGKAYVKLEREDVTLPLPSGHALRWSSDGGACNLELVWPNGKSKPIGWTDSHDFPHVLRWEEVDLLGRFFALKVPNLPHPGLLVALLTMFTPVCDGDDEDWVMALRDAAFRRVVKLPRGQHEKIVRRSDARHAGFVWRNEPGFGWTLSKKRGKKFDAFHVYSCRVPGENFPSHDLDAAMESIRDAYQKRMNADWLSTHREGLRDVARRIVDLRDYASLPLLGDQLRKAKCPHSALSSGCELGVDPAHAAWVLEHILGAPCGSLFGAWLGPTKYPRVK